jgi:hypothetical protein
MAKARIEGNKLILSKPYQLGSEEISELSFGEITAREMGEIPVGENLKFKEYYPLVGMITGMTPGFINKLTKDDIVKAVEHTAFLLAN